LKLGDKGVEKSGLRYYTFEQLRPLLKEMRIALTKPGHGREAEIVFPEAGYEASLRALCLPHLKAAARPPSWTNFKEELEVFEKRFLRAWPR